MSAGEGKKASFGGRIFSDIAAGVSAGFLVSPIVAGVDRALAENASGKEKLFPSFFKSLKEMLVSPIKYVTSPQLRWIWLVYGSTYVAANTCETVCAETDTNPAFPKWISTSLTNTVTCIAKDRAFAQLFGTAAPTNVPMGSYAAWLTRDLVSMGVFFTLPPIVGKQITKSFDVDEKQGYYIAQIGLPLVLQTVTTPIHLLGYDIYNNPNNTTAQRVQFLQKDYFKNVGIRVIRMAPPWSFGTIGNREFRSSFTSFFANNSL